ncbi:carboxymuconolactone decarboxylase family protein, partial [Burkholderia sp. E168m23]
KKAQVERADVDALRDGEPVAEPRLEAVAAFTRAVIATRGAVTDDALDAFLAVGFTEANALEVVLGVSLATLCNFANNLARNELNPELAAYRWEPRTQAA